MPLPILAGVLAAGAGGAAGGGGILAALGLGGAAAGAAAGGGAAAGAVAGGGATSLLPLVGGMGAPVGAGALAKPAATGLGKFAGGPTGGTLGVETVGGGSNLINKLGGMDAVKKQALGLGQMLAGGIQKNNADGKLPQQADPGQTSMLERLKQQLRGVRTGSAFTAEKALVQQTGAATRGALARNSGGNVQSTNNAFLRSQGAENQGINQVITGGDKRNAATQQLAIGLQNQVSSRSLDIQMFDMLRGQANAAQTTTAGRANALSGIFGV